MKNKHLPRFRQLVFTCWATGSIILAISLTTAAQEKRSVSGQAATCKIKVTENTTKKVAGKNSVTTNADKELTQNTSSQQVKNYQPKLNQIGLFDKVFINQPMQTVSIDISYPNGSEHEKVVISAIDGGQFNNGKKIIVTTLNNQKKLSFDFQLTDQPGLFRVMVKKGSDTKVVQLWAEPNPPLSSK